MPDDAGAEEKCLDPLEVCLERVGKTDQEQAVEIHRSANVEENDELIPCTLSCLVARALIGSPPVEMLRRMLLRRSIRVAAAG